MRRVLLVDDNSIARLGLRLMLERQGGYHVIAVEDAEMAIDAIEEGEGFDVVITDLYLPGGMHGGRLVRAMRTIGVHVPVILVTGGDDDAVPSGDFAAVLLKPVRAHELVAAIEAACTS